MTRFTPTRTAALERVSEFLPKAGRDYAAKRNFDLPGHPHVSQLSPYVRHRVITEAEIAAAVLGRFSPSTAEKFLQEVCWRTYWKCWLDRRPSVWAHYLTELQAAENRLATEAGLRASFEAACAGDTGIEGFDDWAKELCETGYLHNHARMWFASIWIFTLRLPWVLGADFFLRHLLDGDPASNTLGWRWVAGIQTPGKTYAARASNISKFTEGRVRPLHQLCPADQIAPLSAPPNPAAGPVPEPHAPDPTLRTGLLLTEDDMSPGALFDADAPVATAILLSPKGRSLRAVSPQVTTFTQGLAQDMAARYASRFGEIAVLDSAEAAATWARDHSLEQLLSPYTPVGPGRSALKKVGHLTDLPRAQRMRPWDAAALPHATAGFFKFKAKIPDLLDTL